MWRWRLDGAGSVDMVIVGRIQRYIFKECLTAVVMTMGIITLAILLVDVVEQMRTVGSRTQISVFTAFQLTMMKAPGLIMQTLPFGMLVGSILAYSQLSRRSEIPAIRAAGVSAWRFLGPVMVLSIALGIMMVTVFDPLATRLRAQFDETRERLINPAARWRPGLEAVWLSQRQVWRQARMTRQAPAATHRRSSVRSASSAAARR